MYCRYVLFEGTEDLSRWLNAVFENRIDYKSNYNTTPGNNMPIVSQYMNGWRTIELFNWGLLPYWATEEIDVENITHVRAETLGDKSKFKPYFTNRRCLIPANGFYEWRENQGKQVPYYVTPARDSFFVMAGLYSKWESPTGRLTPTFCLITSPSHESDNRIPTILPPEVWDFWLNPANLDTDALQELLLSASAKRLTSYPVSDKVDNINNNNPDLILPLETDKST